MKQFSSRVDSILNGQFSDPTLRAILRRFTQRTDVVLFEREDFKERDYWILKGQLDLVRYSLLAPSASEFYISTADGYRVGTYLIRYLLDEMSAAIESKWHRIHDQD
ncbi:hypothetical protein LMG33818_002638 [Halomonadaceae bacterium LMG 33818]|uniref:hypothetical protein n=1 Tax=Cernens ardua TaxID=3402176 RepID=UPI003EDC56C8